MNDTTSPKQELADLLTHLERNWRRADIEMYGAWAQEIAAALIEAGYQKAANRYGVAATVHADGYTQHYGPYDTEAQAQAKADALREEARQHAPWLSPETNAAFDVRIEEVP